MMEVIAVAVGRRLPLPGVRRTVRFGPVRLIVGLKLASQVGTVRCVLQSQIGNKKQGVNRLSHLLNLEEINPMPGQEALDTHGTLRR
jgi:hypothetical protein